jgi:hypothetical protein
LAIILLTGSSLSPTTERKKLKLKISQIAPTSDASPMVSTGLGAKDH